jgi:signal transduction histidine kinase
MLFFFPTGTLPSPRWRPVLVIGIVAVGLTSLGFLVNPVPLALPEPGGALRVPSPLGIEWLGDLISTALVGTVWAIVFTVAAAFVALVTRYRGGGREQREQIRWVAFIAALALLANLVAVGALVACTCDSSPVATVMYAATVVLVFIGMPAALAIAILKYRLYEIDVIINRAVVYGLLATGLTAVYVGVVIGLGTMIGRRGSAFLTISAAVVVALLFQPLRHRAQRFANRVVYGERTTPYQVLSDFAERMGGTYGLDDVLERTAAIIAQGTGATRVLVWLRVGRELRPAAAWPDADDMPGRMPLGADEALPEFAGVTRAVAVRHDDELLGALALEKPRSEPLTPTEDKLLQDLASQAGLVLRNVRLTTELQVTIDELRASRRRLVQAQDEERRKIERNLHDGAQQQLVALTIQLGLLERLADDPEGVRKMATGLQDAMRGALDDLRDLARGIYPPLLADQGLAAALEAQSRKAAVPTTIEADGIGRYPREVESAVYFCALEAIQNVAKYAEATSTVVRLAEREGSLVFEIRDDGRGFDTTEATYGTGMQGMVDRLDAIGGTFDIRSEPGRGTTVRGEIWLP